MKSYPLLYILCLLCACSNEEIEQTVHFNPNGICHGSNSNRCKQAILAYITHNNKIANGEHISRSNKTSITPVLIDGDTLLYYVNYDDGWELFSNNPCLPMLLIKCESGIFNFDSISSTRPLNVFVNNIIHNLKNLRDIPADKCSTDQSWPKSVMENEDNPQHSTIHWTYAGTGNDKSYYIEIPHLTTTHWNVNSNSFGLKEQVNPHNRHVSGIDVAVAQYLKYTHDKIGKPSTCPLEAQRNGFGYSTFSDFSTTGWDFTENNSIDKWIGYVSTINKTRYNYAENGYGITEATIFTDFSNALTTVANLSGRILTDTTVNVKSIESELTRGWPVLGYSKDSNMGFLIDYYTHHHSDFEIYSVVCNCGNSEDDCDQDLGEISDDENCSYEKLVAIFGKENVRVDTYYSDQTWIKCNWGYPDSKANDILISPCDAVWTAEVTTDNQHIIYNHSNIHIAIHR